MSKVAFITGATRGIGRAIALKLAKNGYAVVITGKSTEPHPKLPNTIYSVAKEIEANGGKALAVPIDVRDSESIANALGETINTFGKVDVLINNASAIDNSRTLKLDMKKFDLIQQVNGRGTFLTTKLALPHLLKAENPQVLTLSPPLSLDARWLKIGGVGYTMSKYAMSLCTLGMSEEFKGKVAFNSLWPRYTVATAAVEMVAGKTAMQFSMKPSIMADAAFKIVEQDKTETGNFYIDTEVVGADNVSKYKVQSLLPTLPDLYVGDPQWMETLMRWLKMLSGGKSKL
jgi:citronellol/citronellal dehydrogenase